MSCRDRSGRQGIATALGRPNDTRRLANRPLSEVIGLPFLPYHLAGRHGGWAHGGRKGPESGLRRPHLGLAGFRRVDPTNGHAHVDGVRCQRTVFGD